MPRTFGRSSARRERFASSPRRRTSASTIATNSCSSSELTGTSASRRSISWKTPWRGGIAPFPWVAAAAIAAAVARLECATTSRRDGAIAAPVAASATKPASTMAAEEAAGAAPTAAAVAIEGTIVLTAAPGADPATIAAVDGRRLGTKGTIVAERAARRANGRASDGSDERLIAVDSTEIGGWIRRTRRAIACAYAPRRARSVLAPRERTYRFHNV